MTVKEELIAVVDEKIQGNEINRKHLLELAQINANRIEELEHIKKMLKGESK